MVNLGFWSKFKNPFHNAQGRPILCLAPMADVTDSAFRYIIAKYSKEVGKNSLDTFSSLSTDKSLLAFSSARLSQPAQGTLGKVSQEFFPYVTWTEFVSADGLVRAPEEGRKKLLKDLEFSEIERPIVAQFFTSKPEMMEKAAELAVELGFDGIDINMGCPDKSIEKQGAGAALIKNPKLAREIIVAAKRGAGKLPVSVKTRLGYNKDELETWLPELLAENPAVITVHARTRKEMSKVPARWERVKDAVNIRNEIQRGGVKTYSPSLGHEGLGSRENSFHPSSPTTLIFGNGDVESVEHAYKLAEDTGADGVMLGRAIFGNPFLFSNQSEWFLNKENPDALKKSLEVLLEHIKLFEEKLGGVKSFALMKKHFKSYIGSFSGAKELREKLMGCADLNAVERVVEEFLLRYN